MELPKQRLPAYLKLAVIFMIICLSVYVLYIGSEILVPIVFSALFAVLLNPAVAFLHRKKVPRIVAISVVLVVAFTTLCILLYFIISQMGMFWEKYPVLEGRFSEFLKEAITWISKTFHISRPKVNAWFIATKSELLANSNIYIGSTLSTATDMVITLVLIPIYIFMMIYYEPLFIEFIKQAFPRNNHIRISEMITESKLAMQNYLSGLLVEAVIVAGLNSVGLLLLDIQYAILWGILGAILNVIPYIGGVIAVSLPMLMAILTKDSFSYVFLVMIVYMIVQFIDNNYIIPKVVASKVKLNALISVVVVLIGGALWGVSGMFLSIPLTAVVKIICDRTESLKPIGYLLGDTMPESDRDFFTFNRRKLFVIKKKH
jgi:predicted PurR-regulated permease PerM